MMKVKISKSKFKAGALEYFREIERTGVSIIITDHGKPTLEIKRVNGKDPLSQLRGSVLRYEGATLPVADNDWESAQ